jgi:hypothetical protein
VAYLLRSFIRFLTDQDTIAEVLIVLGIVTMVYFFTWADDLHTVTQQITPAISAASALDR